MSFFQILEKNGWYFFTRSVNSASVETPAGSLS